jgi:hypothetical protein
MNINHLGQKSYMDNVFKCFGMEEFKLVNTPFVSILGFARLTNTS